MSGRNADELLRAWRDSPVPEASSTPEARRRSLATSVIARQIRNAPRVRRSVRQRRWAGLAVAALALCGVGAGSVAWLAEAPTPVAMTAESIGEASVVSFAGEVSVVRGTERAAASPGRSLHAGDAVETAPRSGAAVGLGERAEVRLHAASRVVLVRHDEDHQRLQLARGHVNVDVKKKLAQHQSFVVETPDVEVVVRGTVFDVDVAEPGASSGTTVTVSRGVVVVLRQGVPVATLRAGETYSSPTTNPSTVTPSATAATVDDTEHAPGRAVAKTASRPAALGTLARENALFEAGVAARNRGDDELALSIFEGLLRRFPDSTLAQDTKVERFRALRRLGRHGAAADGARGYLSEHEEGYARDEAVHLSAPEPPRQLP